MQERPTRYSRSIFEKVADELLPDVVEWLQSGEEEAYEVDHQRTREDLIKALESYDLDGYRIARRLEDKFWVPDSDLVDILNRVPFRIATECIIAEKAWVLENAIEPEFPVGSKVIQGRKEGVISSIRKETGYYGVRFEGDAAEYLVTYESVRVIEPQ